MKRLYLQLVICLWASAGVFAQTMEWTDPVTHHRVIRLSRIEGNNASFYFHNNPFIGNKLVFYNTGKNGKQIYTVDLGTGAIDPVTDVHGGAPNGEIVGRKSRSVYYQVRDSVFATNIDSHRTRLVFVFPPGFKASVSTLNADETLLAGVKSGPEEAALLKQYPEKSQFFDRIYDAHIPHTLFVIDTKTGVLSTIHEESTWLGHVQFSPTDPNALMFCHEGPWQKVDRIWLIDVHTQAVRLMHKRTVENEIAGHEFFAPDGRSIYFDWQIPKGETFYLGRVDIATGAETKYRMTRDEWSIHFNVTPDQRLFAGDGGDERQVAKAKNGRWIYLFRPDGDHFVSEKLVDMHAQNYHLEPNVHFSPDGKWVIFRGNFEGQEEVYAVEIAAGDGASEVAPPRGDAVAAWPPIIAETRPWTRWWWMGSAVDTPNLRANMEKYQAAGLGGLELTPIYGVKGYESYFIDYLSPAWMDLFTYTLRQAQHLGLGLDMSTGTGWPFGGGPLIDSVYACKELFYKTWSLKEGESLADSVRYVPDAIVHTDGFPKPKIGQLVRPIFTNVNRQALALDQVRFPEALPLEVLMAFPVGGTAPVTGAASADAAPVNLTSRVDASGHLNWTAPPGDWWLCALFMGAHGKMVERAAPGAEGNVIDHFSSVALKKYLSRFDTAFVGRDLSGLRSFFNDSYEVDDARGQSDWTPGFADAFRAHRGYDLIQHLPALLGKDNDNRVLCDFRETISDLLLEQFTQPWASWAHGRGALVRDQAHGSPANILDLYAASDIPETEGQEILRYKFATSAAHVTGKRLASSESVTWLNEHFLSSLGDIKHALDKYLLGGVNHIIYHGTAYSPADDPWPGWLFYASVHFTPNDPSWPNFSALNAYVARCQSFLQQGEPDGDVLLYYPLYDSWSERGPALLKHYDRMDPEFSGTGFNACASWMQANGYAFDYISDKQVREIQTPIRTSGGASYRAILLPACRHISLEAFQRLVRLASAGATILIYQTLPSDVPGWDDWQARKDSLGELLSGLHFSNREDSSVLRASVGKGVFLMSGDLPRLLSYARIRREQMVDDSLSFVRRKYKDGYVYFIVNQGSNRWEGNLPFVGSSVVVFNPMTGSFGKTANGYVQLEPGESCLIQTSPMRLEAPDYSFYQTAGPSLEVLGPWSLAFAEGAKSIPIRHLGSWTMFDSTFSGTATYRTTIRRPPGAPAAWRLSLGKVDVTAQVFWNGRKIAALIDSPFQVTLGAAEVLDKNALEIRVSNLMANRIEDMDRKGIPWKKFYNTDFPAHDRANRGKDGLFDASKWAPVSSGLLGPVRLTPLVQETPRPVNLSPLTRDAPDPFWVREVGARSLPVGGRFSVNAYGAVKDGETLATQSIQAAIDTCAARGGGVVTFEPGVYLTGALFLKDNVELRIDKGVTLKGSQRFEDYPLIDTRIAGIEMKWPAALINLIGVKKAAVTGEGRVDARGKFCWDKYWAMRKVYDPKGLRWIVDYDAQRVRTLLVQNAEDVTVRGIHFANSGFWTVQVLYSRYVTVDGITVRNNEDGHGPSTDGVDIDSSSWILVQNCDIDCNDDDFCLKAGRDWDGLRVDRPTEYVVIRHCTARRGGGLLTIGSETSGSIRHVLATDLTAAGTGNGFHIKSATTRGGTVEDIHIRHITMDSVGNAILFTMNWNPAYSYSTLPPGYNPDSIPAHWKTMLHPVVPPEQGIPQFRDIYVSDITVGSARKAISAEGLEKSLVTGVHLDHVRIAAKTAGEVRFAKDWEENAVSIRTGDGTKVSVQHSENVSF